MIGETSGTRTPIRLPSPPAEASTYLAPGFRFHPTDEELVSYYLKRKITGRPIRADAISEVDLYRVEPWDLPPQSRIRSRDLEWYFFTSLGHKYSNRCRTNRATAEGYWKTTGKDRRVQRQSRTIGMKKTLVYHSGRAPRGKRTNWVMHEYRLDDQGLDRAGISQDGYVVCRVFQKTGPGPQNGAQYGAPYIEEEWEMEEEEEDVDNNLVPVNADKDALIDTTGQDFVELGDFLQDPDTGIPHLDSFPLETTSSDNQTEDSSTFIEDILNGHDPLDDMPQGADFYVSHEDSISLDRLGENNVLEEQSNYASMQSTGYVQLKDLLNGDDTKFSLNSYSKHYLLDDMSHSKILLQSCVEGESLSNSRLHPLQMRSTLQHEMFPQPFDPSGDVPWEYPSGLSDEDNLVYYDAFSNEFLNSENDFAFEPSLSPPAEFDLSEELMSFFDTANDSALGNQFLSQLIPPNPSECVQSNASLEVLGSNNSSSKEVFHVSDNLTKMSALVRPTANDGPSTGYSGSLNEDLNPEDCEDKTLTERLASMLYSIPAPPAFAHEPGLLSKIPAASGSALHLTAGMIQIDNWAAMGYAESWTLQKHAELGFFSYGIDGSAVSKSIGSERKTTVVGGVLSTFCWAGGFLHLVFLSAVMLGLSYKIGVYACQQP
ncbi:NAC domain-containing protein 78 [Platanthera guangdongensis]|uniref:NAC domain-containing protein 78 n=1 Tax=Platanthera guangdongensis TaxID=2320717 RepID=A0ABR2LMR2_9ASPA